MGHKNFKLLCCSLEQLDQIKKIGVKIPENNFDFKLYSNSKDSLKNLRAVSFNKLTYDEKAKFFLRLAHEVGLDFHTNGNTISLIPNDKYNESLFSVSVQINQFKRSEGTPDTIDSPVENAVEQVEQVEESVE